MTLKGPLLDSEVRVTRRHCSSPTALMLVAVTTTGTVPKLQPNRPLPRHMNPPKPAKSELASESLRFCLNPDRLLALGSNLKGHWQVRVNPKRRLIRRCQAGPPPRELGLKAARKARGTQYHTITLHSSSSRDFRGHSSINLMPASATVTGRPRNPRSDRVHTLRLPVAAF